MFGMGSGEMLVIGVVALIVIGPKDLPDLFRTLGQYTGKARQMAREFSRAMDQAASQSGVSDISKTIKAATNPQKFGMDKLREATKLDTAAKPDAPKPGPATEALAKERAEFKAKMDENAARIRAEKAAAIEASAAEMEADVAEHAAPPAKPAAKPRAKPAAKAETKPEPKPATKPRAPRKPKTEAKE